MTAAQIAEQAAQLPLKQITLEFLTPLRLTAQDHLVKMPEPVVFVQRLIERCQNLVEHYGQTEKLPSRAAWCSTSEHCCNRAQTIQITRNETWWIETRSGSSASRAHHADQWLGGRVRWEGELPALLPWLLWGQSLHVGKDAVKGNGWYRVVPNATMDLDHN